LGGGLRGRWCDRYPNLGKTSGAFSAGSYDGDPYILMNFQENVLNDVFTLAHEAGHSMHSYYSAKHQPFSDYNYRIFVAEVASTFNEQLLSEHLIANCRSKKQRQLLIAREIDNIRGTIYRQVMFAEFERETHAMCEAGEPVLLESLQEIYRRLLIKYLGPQLEIDEYARLECLRIPHFYRAFYVYKYATGMSAAIALAEKVTQGGRRELTAYLNFLKSGQCKYPLELLQDAGVDMTVKAPIVAALSRFGALVQQLDATL
jgi:oligoendopeptidase F